jgi:hypothetical protein
MRLLFAMCVMLLLSHGSSYASVVDVTLEARGLGSEVSYNDVASGFILDVYFDADVPMWAAQVVLDGNSSFYYEPFLDFFPPGGDDEHYGPDWDGELIPGGPLPMTSEDAPAALAKDGGATSGLFVWMEFSALPPWGEYWITILPASYVVDLNMQQVDMGTLTPLHITPEPTTLMTLGLASLLSARKRRVL